MTQSQSSVIKFSYFIFLPPEVSDSKTRGGGGRVPPTFHQVGALMLVSPTFSRHKVNLLSSSSVILFFLPLEVSDNKPEVDGRVKLTLQIIWLHHLNNLEILLIIEKLEKLIKIWSFCPIFFGENRAFFKILCFLL